MVCMIVWCRNTAYVAYGAYVEGSTRMAPKRRPPIDWSKKQRYTALISDLDRGLATRCAHRGRFPGEDPPEVRSRNYPDYDIRYTGAVYRYNQRQIRELEKRCKVIGEKLRKKQSERLMGYLKMYLKMIVMVKKCQDETSRIMGH